MGGQTGVFKRSQKQSEFSSRKSSKSKTSQNKTAQRHLDLNVEMSGIEFIVVTLPSKIEDTDVAEEYGFNPQLAFERVRNGKVTVMMSLGFGRSVNVSSCLYT